MTDINMEDAAALARAVSNLFKRWQVPRELASAMLGNAAEPLEILYDRMAILISIHAALRRKYREPQQGYNWINRPNTAFGELSPLQLMGSGDLNSLIRVKAYLDAEGQCW